MYFTFNLGICTIKIKNGYFSVVLIVSNSFSFAFFWTRPLNVQEGKDLRVGGWLGRGQLKEMLRGQ
jgi:hypothetical protein